MTLNIRKVNISLFLCIILSLLLTITNAFDVTQDVYFELFTREEPHNYHLVKANADPPITSTTFKADRPTRIFVHGYRSKRKVIIRYADAYLRAGDYNFIAVNWMKGSSTVNYYTAKNRVKHVARALAAVIDSLVENGMNLRNLTVVGHSLGAHIVGRAAKQLKSDGKIPVIVGLDPASVLFDFEDTNKRLADTDADYVQVIHTDGGHYSIEYPIGHADFYPNGGRQQPGCPLKNAITNLIEKCSHVRSHAFFLESLATEFPSIQCTTFEEIKDGKCTRTGVIANMGGDLSEQSEKPTGIFYLETEISPPFAMARVSDFDNIHYITFDE